MTSKEAYVAFQDLANKLGSNDNINIDIGRFILLYNKNAKIWLNQKVSKNASREIDEVRQIVRKDISLTKINTTSQYVEFLLPQDWYEHIGGYALCSRGQCLDKVVNINQVKNEEERLVLFDENWRPDFDFEWLPITIGANSMYAYYRDFAINTLYIDYYRYPKDIDIAGYIKVDGTNSTDIDPDLDDMYVNEILDLVVADVSRIYQNNEKMQLDLNRIQQDK